MKKMALLFAACLIVALPLHAADVDKKSDAHHKSAKSDTVKVKTTIEAIDQTNRTLTLREKDGDLVTVYAGQDVQGFENLNVGDRVSLQYREAVALQIHEADEADKSGMNDRTRATNPSGGDPSGAPYDSPSGSPQPGSPTDQPGAPGGGSGAGAASPSGSTTGSETGVTGTPAGMAAEQVTTLATVKDVDTRDQSIKFQTEDGKTVSARVDDRSLVKDLDPGDQVQITYTNPMLVSIEKS